MKKILSLVIVLLLVVGLLAGCGGQQSNTEEPAGGEQQAEVDQKELRKVKMVMPRTIEVLEDTPYWVAIKMGYFEEEGLDVTMEQSFGTTDIKMVSTGNAEFCAPGPSFVLSGIAEALPIKVVSAYDAINIWGMCVLKDSPIQSWEDMRNAQEKYGRKLTVALGDASWELLVTPTIKAAGIDIENDLEFVVAGENRYIQVAEGKLDMLFTWPGEAWQLIGQGFDFIYIDGNDVLKTCSNPIITSLDLIENEPEVVRGFVRGLAKGVYFTKYNPEAAAAIVCDQFPAIDVTWKAAVYVQHGRVYQMFGPEGGEEEQKLVDNIGWNWEDKWNLVVETSIDSGVISEPIPLDRIYTNEFVDLTWDKSKVEQDADNYDIESVKSRYKPE